MENHPIPQDVTGFQFKLIGEMTVKQFAYLAGGVVLAWVTFSIPLFWLIKYPLIFLFAGLGVCLAFVPIEGRPFDVMLMNFLKAFISPNQFVFHKSGYTLLPEVHAPPKVVAKPEQHKNTVSEKNLQKYLNALPKTPKNALDEREMRFLGGLPLQQASTSAPTGNPYAVALSLVPSAPQPQNTEKPQQATVMLSAQPIIQSPAAAPHIITETAPTAPPPAAPEPDEQTSETLEKEAALIQQELTQAKQQEASTQPAPIKAVAHEKVVELEKELATILSQKEKLQTQLITLKKELEMQKQKVFTPSVAQPTQPTRAQTQNVRIIPQGMAKSVGLPITPDVANLLTGIVKDARGNTLPNILVEVKDTDGNPARAFKTNGLGQFAAASPLANGTYTITFEDPQGKQKFDTIELPVAGMIIQPIEVISVDEREQLRQELFKV